MSRNLSDSKQERDLFNRIAKLEQQQREMRTLQLQGNDAVKLEITEPLVGDLEIPGGLTGTFMFKLANPGGKIIFSSFEFRLFVWGFELGKGDQLMDITFPFRWARSWDETDGNAQLDCVTVENLAQSSSETVTAHGRWRYIVSPEGAANEVWEESY